ncbi:ATP-binding protein [Paractinoplanes lichenicola]|uniref:ATP-binding protein n=1 Tax=Paractinoplanes lichenicola TaxID=2802976 RepID=A0ABS1VFP9_9ACTN|nr:ATP-binding protein [Actinoplanes lichenicola]MBL7253522.1 ATP-binding protein [Actinoplanes lichenicola]
MDQQLVTSPPPPDATELHVWVLNSSTELKHLRAALREALARQELTLDDHGSEITDRMVLVATELATNAIKHGRPPTEIRLMRTEEQFILDVADRDLSTVPELAHTRPIDAGGRGLFLAMNMSLQVGWYAGASTKHIWAAFAARPGS